MMPKKAKTKKLRLLPILGAFICALILLLGFLCFFSAKWYIDTYGQMGFDSILYTLRSNLTGVQSDLVESYLEKGLTPALICWTVVFCLLFFRPRKKLVMILFQKVRLCLYPVNRWIAAALCLCFSASMIWTAAKNTELPDYIRSISQRSTIFEQKYRDPGTTAITFPENKRNLIYIYMESMETTYFSQELGGGVKDNLIPELYQLALDNTNFSHNDGVGGFLTTTGSTWTIGAMVSHSAGVPLKTPPGIGGNDYGEGDAFLPGLTTITDILKQNGYYQTLMVGSNAVFGGRQVFYTQHGIDKIYDHATAQADGIISDGYSVWWGMEDTYLYQYAQQELIKLANGDQPFAFTMLTVDTHHIGGYTCALCGSAYAENYENVISCASRQISAFVDWLQQQDFYENTTVVIVGDHLSMDAAYFERNMTSGYTRRGYNCILNPGAEAVSTQNRNFCSLDLFPTTLAAMGCTIEGDRLGLGTNLFSATPTLIEEMGFHTFNAELAKTSAYYSNHFYYKK